MGIYLCVCNIIPQASYAIAMLNKNNFQFPYIYVTFQRGRILNCKPQSIFT